MNDIQQQNHLIEKVATAAIDAIELVIKANKSVAAHAKALLKEAHEEEKHDLALFCSSSLLTVSNLCGVLKALEEVTEITKPKHTGHGIKVVVHNDDGGICSDITWQVTHNGETVATCDSYEEAQLVARGKL